MTEIQIHLYHELDLEISNRFGNIDRSADHPEKSRRVVGKDEADSESINEKVIRKQLSKALTPAEKVYPEIEVKVSPDISGEIVELNVLEGDSVKKERYWQNICRYIYYAARPGIGSGSHRNRQGFKTAAHNCTRFKSRTRFRKRTYDRQKQLLDDKVISRSEFEQAQNSYQRAEADYNSALETIRGGQAGVASARASLKKQIRI